MISCIGGGGGGRDKNKENYSYPTDNTVPKTSPYIVIAWNDLGMHCLDKDFSVFSILPPFNTLHAQVIKTGKNPKILDPNSVSVYYKATTDYDGSINSFSDGKTNF